MTDVWHRSACILCSINCGIEIKLDDRHFARIRGDKAHPASKGYTCEKALRLDHYQNGNDRITSPLRRRDDGSYEAVDWNTAISEVAARLIEVRDTHGGETILYYGGGGQGNHLPGAYARATRYAMGSRFSSNALAQEKTGEFWVDGELFGKTSCHTTGDYERAEVAVFLGKNPWQSHGFPRARVTLKEIGRDPDRALVVIDPRRTETADLADHHLQVRPGGDAYLLAAILAILVADGLVDESFIVDRTSGIEPVLEELGKVPISEYCERAGLEESQVRAVARRIGEASSLSIYEDLGIQQAPHSTLNSYLEKLIYLMTGNFGRRGAMNLHTRLGGPTGGSSGRTSPVGGHRIITGLIPANAIPDEILTDHPNRFRAAFVESANPLHSLADSPRMREAFEALDFVVVIDVAMTETARQADYVLPAASQYEKWEMTTLFALEFPENYAHLRSPVLEPLPGTLPEAEIHRRLVRAMGALDDEALVPLHAAAASGRTEYGAAFFAALATVPGLGRLAPVVLYETLGPTFGEGNEAVAVVWGLAHQTAAAYPDSVRRAGFSGDGPALGEALFEGMLHERSGVIFSEDPYRATWDRLASADGRINLAVPELLEELGTLPDSIPESRDPQFPLVLAAGERRSSTANTLYRDPAWRKKDRDGALRMSPADARPLGLSTGDRARLVTRRGAADVVIEISETLLPGHVTLPNGLGVSYTDDLGEEVITGVAPNELTSSDHRDWLAGTPLHKHVPARVEAAT